MDNLVMKTIEEIQRASMQSGWTGINVPEELETASGLWVTKAGARFFPGGFHYNPGKNNHWEWGAAISGSFEFESGGRMVKVPEGHAYIMPPDIPLIARPVDNPFLVWVEVAGPNTAGAFGKIGGKQNELVIAKYSWEQVKHILKIAKLLHEHPYGYGLNVQSSLWGFIAISVFPDSVISKKLSPDIKKVIDFLGGEGADKICLGRLAQISGFSVETFRKKFCQETGESPVKYILKLRMKRAKELLSDKDLTIKQVAGETGFDDQYYFSRLFKKYEGLSPGEFRKRFYPELFL